MAVAAAVGALPASGESEVAEDAAYGMLIDTTRCTGCNSCALACKSANGLKHPTSVPTQIDSDSFSFVDERHVVDAGGQSRSVFVKRQCMHCVHPACASACTVGALRKTAEGPVVYDSDKCIGCRYCQYACPFGLPVYEWENALGLIGKCQMCVSRMDAGELPACASACPNGAIRFGKRSALLREAHAQIETNPGRYVDYVFGEHEVGGTSILYLGPVPFERLGFPTLGGDPNPRYAEQVMKKTPYVALAVAALAAGLQYMTGRHSAHLEFSPVGRDEEAMKERRS
jgi:formate dehydrogenase iron-sulfur subunit